MGRRQHVCQPYGVEQHDAGRARRHDARRMGAALGNVMPGGTTQDSGSGTLYRGAE